MIDLRSDTVTRPGKEMLEAISQVGKVGGWELNLMLKTNSWSSVTKEIHEVEQDFVPDYYKAINFFREGEHRNSMTQLIQKAIKQGESFDAQLQVVTTKGNSFIRNISAAIDAKLWKNELGMEANTFSKAI